MKSSMLTFTAVIVLLNCNCFIFSSYQSAKMLNKGEKNITPSGGASIYTDFKGQSTVLTPVGFTMGFGKSERINLLFTEGFYGCFWNDDEGIPYMSFFNYGGFEVKLGLRKDKLALLNYIYYHIGAGDYFYSLQTGTKLIKTFYFPSGMDITLTPHIGYVFAGYSGPALGTHVSVGVPLNENVTIRPEAGITTVDFSEECVISLGLGFTISR
jgi:hypothetical protein